MADLTIGGPDGDPLTMADVMRALGVTQGQLLALIKGGTFPPGIRNAHKAQPLWRSLDVASFLWLAGRGCRLVPAERKSDEKSDEEDFS